MSSEASRGSAFRSIGVAVVGSTGHAARVVAPSVAALERARLVGVLGSSPQRGAALASRFPDARAYRDWSELLRDAQVQAVWVGGPNDRHVEFASQCLTAGKHVLLEKPMATSTTDAHQLADLAERLGLLLKVAFQHRFRPVHAWLRDALAQGLVGETKLLRIHRFWPYPYFEDMPDDPKASWRSSLTSSGGWVLNDIGAHLVDLALWLLGQPLRLVSAETRRLKFVEAEAEDTALLMLESDRGALVSIETSNAMSSFPGTIEVHGTRGWARADGTFDELESAIVTHTGDRRIFAAVDSTQPSELALADFLGGIEGATTIGASAREAAANVAIICAAAESRRS